MNLAHSTGVGEAPSVDEPEAQRAPSAPAPDAMARLPAFEVLYREHFDFVWRTLLRMGVPRCDVEDQLQEVFKVVYMNREVYDGRASVRAWLFGITHNVSRSWRRGVRRKGIFDALPEVLPDFKSASAEQSATVREDLALLARVLDALDADLRDVFVMTELLEMTAREIGESLSLSSNTVSARLRRAWIEVDHRVALLRKKHP